MYLILRTGVFRYTDRHSPNTKARMKFPILKLFVPLLLVLSARSTYSSDCNQTKLDVVVLLDGSGSVGWSNFNKMKNTTIQLAKDLSLEPHGNRLGVIVYSTRITERISISTDIRDLELKILSIRYQPGTTKTHLGIKAAMEMLESQKREGVRKVGIVTTDGKSNYKRLTIAAAETAKQDDITLFAVGIGKSLRMGELEAIGSDPSYVLHPQSFDDLTAAFKSVEEKICFVCTGELDIVAVLDASGSIGKNRFEMLKDAAIQVTKYLQLGPGTQRFGVVVFNHRLLNTIPLSSDSNDLQSKISSLNSTRGGTATHKGIEAMAEMFASFGRNGVRKVGIIVTDGRSRSPAKTESAATAAKSAGISMYAVGIGPSKNLSNDELIDIASSSSDVLHVKSLDLLKSRFEFLIQTICNVTR